MVVGMGVGTVKTFKLEEIVELKGALNSNNKKIGLVALVFNPKKDINYHFNGFSIICEKPEPRRKITLFKDGKKIKLIGLKKTKHLFIAGTIDTKTRVFKQYSSQDIYSGPDPVLYYSEYNEMKDIVLVAKSLMEKLKPLNHYLSILGISKGESIRLHKS